MIFFPSLELEKLNQQINKKPSLNPDTQTDRQNNNQKSTKLKFSYKEQREFETIDEDIAALEQQLTELELQISNETSDYECLQELLKQQQTFDEALSLKMDRWVYLNDLADKINN